MANNCFSCNSPYSQDLSECPTCHMLNLQAMAWVPEDMKIKYRLKYEKKRTKITDRLLEKKFRKILNEYNITPIRLKVKSGRTGLFEIKSYNPEQTNLLLTYNPYTLAYYDEDEIEAMLYHEGFHPLTSKRGEGIRVQEMAPELMDYVSDFTAAYEEYINYVQNFEYYDNSKSFHSVKTKEISNYDLIFANAKYKISNGLMPHGLYPHLIVGKVFLDLIYFTIFNTSEIDAWASNNNFTVLLRFYKWIKTDFDYIFGLKPDQDKIYDLTQTVARLTVSVIASELIIGNNMEFTPEAFNIYAQIRKVYDDDKHADELKLVRNWLDRFNSTYST